MKWFSTSNERSNVRSNETVIKQNGEWDKHYLHNVSKPKLPFIPMFRPEHSGALGQYTFKMYTFAHTEHILVPKGTYW